MKLSPENQKRREIAEVRRTIGPATLRAIENVTTASLVPYSQNARTHDEKQLSVIERSHPDLRSR